MAVKVLFIGTPYMNLYREIISEMRRQGYEVDFHAEGNYLEAVSYTHLRAHET